MSETVADDLLRSFFSRWQRLQEEKKTISDDLKELFAEAKGMGFDTKAMRAVFREEAGDKLAAEEFDAICDLYRSSLRGLRAHPARHAREIIEEFDAETGEIHEQPETVVGLAEPACDQDADAANTKSAQIPHSLPSSSPATDNAGEIPPPVSPAPIPDDDIPAFLRKPVNLRPHCLNPDLCAGSGRDHCWSCRKAMAESEAA